MGDINTILKDMPPTIRSFVILNNDGTYTIILNSKLTRENNVLAYLHELRHIRNDDYSKELDVDLIELNTHN